MMPLPHARRRLAALLRRRLESADAEERAEAAMVVRSALVGRTVPEAAEELGLTARSLRPLLARWPSLYPPGWHDGRWRHGRRAGDVRRLGQPRRTVRTA